MVRTLLVSFIDGSRVVKALFGKRLFVLYHLIVRYPYVWTEPWNTALNGAAALVSVGWMMIFGGATVWVILYYLHNIAITDHSRKWDYCYTKINMLLICIAINLVHIFDYVHGYLRTI